MSNAKLTEFLDAERGNARREYDKRSVEINADKGDDVSLTDGEDRCYWAGYFAGLGEAYANALRELERLELNQPNN